MKKKFGYTLAEVLIALGIIGFISAIMLPMINKVKPDSTKAMYLATYDAVVSATNEMASNINAYPIYDKDYNYPENITPDWDFSKAPLYNINNITVGGVQYGGQNKYCKLLSISLNTIDDSNSCDKNASYSDNTFQNNISFTDTRGVQYLVNTTIGSGNSSYKSEVYFDINGYDGNNCIFNSGTCKNPDRFKLEVAADGSVFEADPIGAGYIKYRDDWTKKKRVDDIDEDELGIGDLAFKLTPTCENAEVCGGITCYKFFTNGGSCPSKLEIGFVSQDQSAYNGDVCSSKGMRYPTLNELLSIANYVAGGDMDDDNHPNMEDVTPHPGIYYWTSTKENSNFAYTAKITTSFNANTNRGHSSVKLGRAASLCVK